MDDDENELKQQLEKLAGRAIELEPEALKRILFYPAAAYDFSGGSVTTLNIFFPGKRCRDTRLLDAGGVVTTGDDGKRTFLLSDFVCLSEHRLLAPPVNLLATAQSDRPVFVTALHSLVEPNDLRRSDVRITLNSWEAGGAPAPHIGVHWRCRVVSEPIIL